MVVAYRLLPPFFHRCLSIVQVYLNLENPTIGVGTKFQVNKCSSLLLANVSCIEDFLKCFSINNCCFLLMSSSMNIYCCPIHLIFVDFNLQVLSFVSFVC
jgi:hypothetical protein